MGLLFFILVINPFPHQNANSLKAEFFVCLIHLSVPNVQNSAWHKVYAQQISLKYDTFLGIQKKKRRLWNMFIMLYNLPDTPALTARSNLFSKGP